MTRMNRKARFVILFVSLPLVAFTIAGGFLGQAVAREDTYRHLRIFEDVVSLITNNYVEEVELEGVIQGALRGLADGLDSESAFLSAAEVLAIETGESIPTGELGLDIASQYYTQIISVRPGSPAQKAGLTPGDFIRTIDGQTTRRLSVIEAKKLLLGSPGEPIRLSLIRGNTTEPHDIELTLERPSNSIIETSMKDDTIGYIRLHRFSVGAADEIASSASTLLSNGARAFLVDVRNISGGSFDEAIATARLFVESGTLLRRTESGSEEEVTITAVSGDQAIDVPVVLLTDFGTAHAAEVFVAGLAGTERADTVGQRTAGRVSLQKLIKLPDGTGLWLSWARYLKASGDPIHRAGILPTVSVEIPSVELGEPIPPGDPILEQGVEHIRSMIL